jgi:hypothetical protein
MITEVFIEGNKLDLIDNLGGEITLQIDDVKDFASRNTTYSKTIEIAGNANNNKLFGHIYNFSASNNYGISDDTKKNVGYYFDPTRQAECFILIDNIQVFKGVLRLLEIKINKGNITYECSIFGELGGFISSIGNKLLDDNELRGHYIQYNQNWYENNIVNSWDNTTSTGVVFPLIDYGLVKHGAHSYHINAFRPAFFVHELFDKIMDFSGYTYESTFIDSAFFKSLIIPNNSGIFKQTRTDLLSVGLSSVTMTDATPVQVTFEDVDVANFTNTTNQFFTYTGASSAVATLTFDIVGTNKNNVSTFIRVYKNSTVIDTYEIPANAFNLSGFSFVNKSYNITMNTNDQFKVEITKSGTNALYQTNIAYCFLNIDVTIPQTAIVTYNNMLSIPNLLPKNVTQKEFIASLIKMFNLYIFEDRLKSKHLIIEPYINFYNNFWSLLQINTSGNEFLLLNEANNPDGCLALEPAGVSIIDWSNKVDRDGQFSLKPMSELGARFYDFKYKEDDDYYNESYNKKYNTSYGDRREDIKNQFAEDNIEAKILFASSPLVTRVGDDKLATAIYSVSNEEEERKDSVLRILQFKKVVATHSWHIVGDSGGNLGSSRTHYGYAGHLDSPISPSIDLNFGVPKEIFFTLSGNYPSSNLFTLYWAQYLAEITSKDSTLLTCDMYLNSQDISQIDFGKLINIDGSLWRLNKIIDWNPETTKTTKVELLRVIETDY